LVLLDLGEPLLRSAHSTRETSSINVRLRRDGADDEQVSDASVEGTPRAPSSLT
jgi:hypothetical protein